MKIRAFEVITRQSVLSKLPTDNNLGIDLTRVHLVKHIKIINALLLEGEQKIELNQCSYWEKETVEGLKLTIVRESHETYQPSDLFLCNNCRLIFSS